MGSFISSSVGCLASPNPSLQILCCGSRKVDADGCYFSWPDPEIFGPRMCLPRDSGKRKIGVKVAEGIFRWITIRLTLDWFAKSCYWFPTIKRGNFLLSAQIIVYLLGFSFQVALEVLLIPFIALRYVFRRSNSSFCKKWDRSDTEFQSEVREAVPLNKL